MQTNRSNAGALVGGSILIAFGLLSLAGQILRPSDWGIVWPLIIVGFGALFFVAMFAGGKGAAAFAIPGSIVSGIGLMLLFQTVTQHWESMSYFWTLIILFVGAGIYIMGWYGGDANQKGSGLRVMKVGGILFIIFGVFFEMIFSSYRGILFPLLLILLGGYFIVSRSGLFGRKSEDSSNNSLPPSS